MTADPPSPAPNENASAPSTRGTTDSTSGPPNDAIEDTSSSRSRRPGSSSSAEPTAASTFATSRGASPSTTDPLQAAHAKNRTSGTVGATRRPWGTNRG